MSDKLVVVVHAEDEYSVVINRGSEHGVTKGDKYLVYSLGVELFDPDSGESLGQLEKVRGKAVVKHVQEKMSTLETIEVHVTPGAKRIIKRDDASGLRLLALGLGQSREEVEDGPTEERMPLYAEVGDFAKPI